MTQTPPLPPLPPLTLRVSALYLGLYLHYGFFAFLPLWLSTRGMPPTAIGGLMAVPLVLRILTVAPVAGLVGRKAWVRAAIGVSAVVSAVLIAVLGLVSGLAVTGVLFLLFSFAWDQIPVLTDAYAVMAVRSQALDFGRLRVWGSIGVVASSAGGGWVISQLHVSAVPLLVAGLLLLPAAAALWLPADRRLVRQAPDAPDTPEARGGWRGLIGDRPLMAGMLAASLITGSQGVLLSFGAIQWTAAGVPASMIGLLNAVAVVSEIGFFWFGKRLLGARDPRLMLVIAALAAVVRWLVMATSPKLPVLVIAQLLQGVSATGAILGAMLLIAARVPTRLSAPAQGLNAVLLGLALAVSTAGSGLLWQAGPAVAYAAMAALAGSALVPLALLRGRRGAAAEG